MTVQALLRLQPSEEAASSSLCPGVRSLVAFGDLPGRDSQRPTIAAPAKWRSSLDHPKPSGTLVGASHLLIISQKQRAA